VHHSKPGNTAKAPIGNLPQCPRINVGNRQRKIPVNAVGLENFAAKAVRRCLEAHKTKTTELATLRDIFVWLISDRRMTRLHRQFLGETGPTDVLTFQHGEIFISVEMAKRQARVFGNSLVRELQLYIVHGLLHLHGFDDRTRAQACKMKKAQERILRHALSCGAKRNISNFWPYELGRDSRDPSLRSG
jgi:probable rRNA maturation factor